MAKCQITWKSSARYPASLAREAAVISLIVVRKLAQQFDELIHVILSRGKAGDKSEHGFIRAHETGR